MLIQKSGEFNIELKTKNIWGETAFHLACINGMTKLVEMMIENSDLFKLILTARDDRGRTGFQYAKQFGNTAVVDLIERKMPHIAFTN